jgi:hypothetical protein
LFTIELNTNRKLKCVAQFIIEFPLPIRQPTG